MNAQDKAAEEQTNKVKEIILARRKQVCESLEQLFQMLDDGQVRTLAVIAVMKNGQDYHSLHVEEGSSSPEVFGLVPMLQSIVAAAKA